MVLDNQKYVQMSRNFPRNLSININQTQLFQRKWIRNWYFLLIGCSFGYLLHQSARVAYPYLYADRQRRQFKIVTDYQNNSYQVFEKPTTNYLTKF